MKNSYFLGIYLRSYDCVEMLPTEMILPKSAIEDASIIGVSDKWQYYIKECCLFSYYNNKSTVAFQLKL